MAETKRVSDQYKISSPSIILDGNLTVTGSTTSVETINSTVNDNIIVLNDGELGAGVTAGTAGIEIERGSLSNTTFTFNETDDAWEVKIGGSYAVIRGAPPVGVNDLATKGYIDLISGVAGSNTQIQFNDNGDFGASANLTWDEISLTINDIEISAGVIQSTTTNGDIELIANGSGTLYLRSIIKMENEVSDPSATSSTNKFYAKVPGNAGSGLYFVNTTTSDELVSRSKAILFGLIF